MGKTNRPTYDELEDIFRPEEKEEVEESTTKTGVVTNCESLNIRKTPSIKSDRLGSIQVGSEVIIDMERSVEGWYAVYTETGMEGYCMSTFVTVKE